MSKSRSYDQEYNYDFYQEKGSTFRNGPDIGEEHFSHKKDRAQKRWEKIKRKKSRWDDDYE